MKSFPDDDEPEFVHGAKAIGRVLGTNERRARHLIEGGHVPGIVRLDNILTLHLPTFRAGIKERARHTARDPAE
jgi:hypothetical protein